jgi:membrane-associated protein
MLRQHSLTLFNALPTAFCSLFVHSLSEFVFIAWDLFFQPTCTIPNSLLVVDIFRRFVVFIILLFASSMEFFAQFVDLFLHLDAHLGDIIRQYGIWTYAILFLIVFAETGLVFAPLLPGDSLLFAAGTLAAATGALDPLVLTILLCIAAILGDTVNYSVGSVFGTRVLQRFRFIKREHITYTEEFYQRHGGKTVILARFIPIVRTFAPFVAGIGAMNYTRFIIYNVVGGIVWVVSFVYLGYWFGNIPIIKRSFSLVIIGIVILSILPGIVKFIQAYLHKRAARSTP